MTKTSGGAVQEWFSAAELAELRLSGLPSTKRGVQQLAEREGWAQAACDVRGPLARPRRGRGGGTEYHVTLLPESVRAQLLVANKASAERPDRESMWMRWERLPGSLKDEAQRRLAVIEQVETLHRKGLGKAAAVDEVVKQAAREARAAGQKPPFSASTVFDWFRRVAGVDAHDRAAYLAPDYAGRSTSCECPGEAFELYKADYLRQSRPTHAACYRNLERIAAERGWTLPSAKTLQRRLEAEVPVPLQVYLREGGSAADHTYPHRERDKTTLLPMAAGNLDGHTWDVFVRWPGGEVSRPLSLAVQDIASGKILAIRFDLTLNHHLVRLALGDTFRDYGLFDSLFMDNGRENAAQAISGGQARLRWGKTPEEEPDGLLKTLGVKALFVKPYWGQAKPIERAFRNFAHDIAKRPEFEGAYTGHNPVSKPENYASRAVPFAEFEAIVRRELAYYNAQLGRTGQGMNGRSFDQVFEEGLARRSVRRLTPEQLRLCMLASKPVAMDPRAGAVKVEGHRYWSPELGNLKRQRVIVRFDPERMDLPAFVYSLDGRLLAKADRIAAGSFDNLADGREQNKAVRDHKRGLRIAARAAVKIGPRELAAQHAQLAPPSSPKPAGRVVALVPNAPRSAEQLGRAATKDFDADWERGVAATLGR
jgi:hypothetical protein